MHFEIDNKKVACQLLASQEYTYTHTLYQVATFRGNK